MDWLEEFVQSGKAVIKNAKLSIGLFFTLVLHMAGALVLYIVTRNICYGWIIVLEQRYSNIDNFYSEEALRISIHAPFMVEVEVAVLRFFYFYGLYFYALVAVLLAIRWYFKHKINPGLQMVKREIGYLTIGDYSHETAYHEKDEIGAITDEIEILRKQLVEMKQGEWNLQMEQSSINAAFAHDMRTPLTVMKGYTEFLLKYVPKGKVNEAMLMEKLTIMLQHQERLLEFSKTMTEIQTMEMHPLHGKWIAFQELLEKVQVTVNELAKQSTVNIKIVVENQEKLESKQLFLDPSIVLEVCENLLTNGLRYSIEQVEVKLTLLDDYFTIYVSDDGDGFSVMALKEAKKLYFSEEKGQSNHFGMGLYICEKLCEKHGGSLAIVNGVEKGAVVAAQFHII